MFVAVYRWRLKPGMEDQFVDGWERVTRAIWRSCGSCGSRLHQCSDDTWLAYARWPDAATRDACEHEEPEDTGLCDAVADHFEDVLCTMVRDLLAEPDHLGPDE